MGFNDASNRMRTLLGLSSRKYAEWPKHIVAKTREDGVINAYNNYLLDPNCPTEPWHVFIIFAIQEFLDSGANLRNQELHEYKCTYRRSPKRPRPGNDAALLNGSKCRGGRNISSIRELRTADRTRHCAFCRRQKAKYKCRSCGAHLCMTTSAKIIGRSAFNPNGPSCYLRQGF